MFFRIQTLYLLLAFITTLLSGLFLIKNEEITLLEEYQLYSFILFIISSVMVLLSILRYRARLHQFIINRLNIILHIILLGYISYQIFENNEVYNFLQKSSPLICITLLTIANRYIKKDEDLIRSIDRIR